jgi:23S rRNA (pseudouridine1915-N3)-methyltransferase
MRIDLVVGGPKPAKCWQAAVGEYAKRLGGFASLGWSRAQGPGDIGSGGKRTHVAVAPDGVKLDSEAFAARIEAIRGSGKPDIAFWIGCPGPAGAERIALTALDMEPGLQAALVAEQAYRASRILTGQPYHR